MGPDDEVPESGPEAAAGVGLVTTILGGGTARALVVQRMSLQVLTGSDAGAVFKANGDRMVIGTHPSADAVLTDATVSRLHCELVIELGRVSIRDLGSKNGTYVDGVSVVIARLRPGATIALGRTTLRFDVGGESLQLALSERERFGLMVGASAAMRRTFSLLERAATSEATVLLEGETGTGKELAAESLHQESGRKNGPFIVVDCGAIPPELLESELFGHEKGAFTGAVSSRDGAFLDADGGTIFLDEIGELPIDLQPKLLRVLEARTVKRVGSSRQQPVDVRVVAATNRDLQAEVNARRFRPDLYYRLAVVRIRLPPLRERADDLPHLVDHLLGRIRSRADEASLAFIRSPAFQAELKRHPWPGNVRELRNYLERCVAMREPSALGEESLETDDRGFPAVDITVPLKTAREAWVNALERQYLEKILQAHGDNVSAAARAADMDRVHFHRLLRRHGLRG
jgi:DNA-binding NtrC family response regulator